MSDTELHHHSHHDHHNAERNSPPPEKISYSRQTKIVPGDRRLFAVCFLGIFVSYFVYGVLQENITKTEHGEGKERFTYTMALVFVQCVVNALFAKAALYATSEPGGDTAPRYLYMIMSFSYVGAMLSSNDALRFISYPTQVLGKSVKPIPVMILGVILARKRYPLKKYLYVLMIVVGVALFMYKPKKAAISSSSVQSSGGFSVGYGEFLLMVSLLLDGVTGGTQDKIRAQYKTQTHRMMLLMNVWSCLYLAVGLLLSGEMFSFLSFCQRYPWVLVQLILFSVCSAIGQNFIFMTITNFGPLPCSIITTTRKFFTILASVLIFGHAMTSVQWWGTVLVFAGLSLDSLYGKEHKQKSIEKS